MIDVASINQLHADTVQRWHQQAIDNPYQGLLWIICNQHSYNYQLWHQEDIARSPEAGDGEIAAVKRRIDRLNQQRNDWIEKVDDAISEELIRRQVVTAREALRNTETPGSAVDRLSILALRIYHLQEQLERTDVDGQHRERVTQRLAICQRQQQDLSQSLQELLNDIVAGVKRHSTYRQLKMYNDPTLNPYLYGQQRVPQKVVRRQAG